jgi:hypothetical protein
MNQGSGRIWQDNYDSANVVTLYIDHTDNNGNDVQNWKASFNSANNPTGNKGHLALRRKDDETSFVIYNVISLSSFGDQGDHFDAVLVELVEKSPSVGYHECPFVDGNNLVLQFFRAGDQGSQGYQGFGTQGVQGTQGYQGSQGNQGRDGAAAYQGYQGVQGYQGIGPQGYQGLGAQGYQGAQGTQGYQGLGVQGAQGIGSQGYDGCPSCFELAWNETIGDVTPTTTVISPYKIWAQETHIAPCGSDGSPVLIRYQFMGASGESATVILNTTPFVIHNENGSFVWDWQGNGQHYFNDINESINQDTDGCIFSVTFNGGSLFFTLLKVADV